MYSKDKAKALKKNLLLKLLLMICNKIEKVDYFLSVHSQISCNGYRSA